MTKEIKLANPRGFCAGVDRAIDIVNKALDIYGAPVYVKHEVVHNKVVVNDLRNRGAIFVEEIDEIPDDSLVIFSAHGVSREVEENTKSRNLNFFDATCPLVTKVHMEVKKYANANKDIILIEDSAHALGSSYLNQKCGSLGSLSIFSFTPHKIITMGQGGMVLSDDEILYQKLIDIKTFNREKDKSDVHRGFGLNFKITDLQSSLGLSQLSKLEEFIKLKKDLHRQYSNNINDKYLKSFNEYETPWFIDLYCNSQNQREELHLYLKQKNIETRFSYPSLNS